MISAENLQINETKWITLKETLVRRTYYVISEMSQTNEEGFFIQRIRLRTLMNFREKQDPQRRRNTVNEHIKNTQSC